MRIEDFWLPFEGTLSSDNRWAKLAEQIPWAELCQAYEKRMSPGKGRPSKPARLVIGAMIIKHKLRLSDEETVEQIRENPYLQYFCGYEGYSEEPPFVPSLFVTIRRRMGPEVFDEFEQAVVDAMGAKRGWKRPTKGGDDAGEHRGKLRLDATVAEQGIRYPTDQRLLHEARQEAEAIVDELYPKTARTKKPRTYRRNARRAYLRFAKRSRPSKRDARRATREQLQYLRRDLKHIDTLLDEIEGRAIPLPHAKLHKLWVIREIYRQQDEMYRDKARRCDDRIVSIGQPQVRPMVRGKAKQSVEFGAKLAVSLDDNGLARVDGISWDAYHEASDLKRQVEAYERRYGYKPEVVLADQIYGTRENRRWLKEQGIRFGGRALGRPPKDKDQQRARKRQQRQDELARIPIEGKFGQGKRSYGLGRIDARTPETSQAWIQASFLVMNVLALARTFLRRISGGLGWREGRPAQPMLAQQSGDRPALAGAVATI